MRAPQQGKGHIINRHTGRGAAFGAAVVCVPVNHGCHGVAIQGFFEAPGAQERENFGRLVFDGRPDRGVMEDGDATLGPQSRQGGLELHGLVDRFLNEGFDGLFAPGAQSAPAEAAGEPACAGEADSAHFNGITIEQDDAGLGQDSPDFVFTAGLEVVIAEHGDDGQLRGDGQLLDQELCLLGQAVVREVSAQHNYIRELIGLFEQRANQPAGILAAVNIADGRNSHEHSGSGHHSLRMIERPTTPRRGDWRRENESAKRVPARHLLCIGSEFASASVVEGTSDMDLAPVRLNPKTRVFYVRSLAVLNESGVPFLVGGAYALARHAGIERHTKDLDIFVYRDDCEAVLAALAAAGFRTEVPFPHWLAKAHGDDGFIDVIYSSGNGVCRVDREWFAHASDGEILGVPVKLCPVEEMIWSKGYVQERERFDGADIAHLIRSRGDTLDWDRLRRRFGEHWRVLFSHLITFGFIYPAERDKVPRWLLKELTSRFVDEIGVPLQTVHMCFGTLLSREQYLPDIGKWGYHDARIKPRGPMTPEEVANWTEAIAEGRE